MSKADAFVSDGLEIIFMQFHSTQLQLKVIRILGKHLKEEDELRKMKSKAHSIE